MVLCWKRTGYVSEASSGTMKILDKKKIVEKIKSGKRKEREKKREKKEKGKERQKQKRKRKEKKKSDGM